MNGAVVGGGGMELMKGLHGLGPHGEETICRFQVREPG